MAQNKKVSRGCQICQQGKWLCIFLTYRCNGGCHFCPAPFKNDQVHSAFGNRKENILSFLIPNDFEGISFSGGDPFTVYDRLLEWFTFFKKNLPSYYYWVYTNGLAVDRNKLEELAAAGMDEIRFNIAATGYLSDSIWKKIKIARELFPYVTIEIPSIKNDYESLARAVRFMEETGIDYLNLHDYIQTGTDPDFNESPTACFQLNKTTPIEYAVSSKENTRKIDELCRQNNIVHVNNCNMEQKEIQMLQRRIMMGNIFNNPEYDSMTADGIVYNYYKFSTETYPANPEKILRDPVTRNQLNPFLIKKGTINNPPSGKFKIIKAGYIPKMEKGLDKILIEIKEVNNPEKELQ